MVNTSSEKRPGRILKYSATLLVAVLLAYAAFLVVQSWRETKSEQASQLATIAALSENAIDIYFTQLQIGMQNLGADLAVTLAAALAQQHAEVVASFIIAAAASPAASAARAQAALRISRTECRLRAST